MIESNKIIIKLSFIEEDKKKKDTFLITIPKDYPIPFETLFSNLDDERTVLLRVNDWEEVFRIITFNPLLRTVKLKKIKYYYGEN